MSKTDIADKILLLFNNEHLKTNDIITEKWLKFLLIDKLEEQDKPLVPDAILELVAEELIFANNENGWMLQLTQKGFNHIYKMDRNKAINNIGKIIMQHFAEIKAKPNHKLSEIWLKYELMEKLNPKERELINLAIDSLIRKGYVVLNNEREFCLVLTQNGFDIIN